MKTFLTCVKTHDVKQITSRTAPTKAIEAIIRMFEDRYLTDDQTTLYIYADWVWNVINIILEQQGDFISLQPNKRYQ
jgi:hypothetical protein